MRVVTEQEEKMRRAFNSVMQRGSYFGTKMLTEQVFCFKCGQFWHSDSEWPEGCRLCHYRYNEVEQWAKPDIVLETEMMTATVKGQFNPNPVVYSHAVIRIDEEKLHRKNKKKIMHDYWQIKGFEQHKVRVFILLNEEIDDYYPWRLTAIATFIVMAANDDDMYAQYRADKDIKYRFSDGRI